jgi:hypothetical protein
MNIDKIIYEAIIAADADAPTRGEVLENFHDRRAAYVLAAIEKATGVTRADLEKPADRVWQWDGSSNLIG